MPFATPTLGDLRRQVRDDIAAHLPGADALVPNSVLRVLADAKAGLAADLHQHLGWLADQVIIDRAEAEWLDRYARIWLPGGRLASTFASGAVTVTGVPGSIVPAGARLAATDGSMVVVLADVTLTGTSAAVAVTATEPGSAGNIGEGRRLRLTAARPGINAEAVVAAPGLAGGLDPETDARLLRRLLLRIQQPPHGGAAHDYVAWSLARPGVTRAWTFAGEMGVGTVTVRFMMDDLRAGNDGIPNSGDAAGLRNALDGLRPVTVRDFFVVAPLPRLLDIAITDLATDTPATRAAIADGLRTMLLERSEPGKTIWASWISEAVSRAVGEDRHRIVGLSDVVPAHPGEIVVMGSVVYE